MQWLFNLPTELIFWETVQVAGGGLLFLSIVLLLVLVRITTPSMRIESMASLGWQPLFWGVLSVFVVYFIGWFLA